MKQLGVMCIEKFVAYWKVSSGYVHGWTEEKLEKSQDIPAQKVLETFTSRIPSTYMIHSDRNGTFATTVGDKQGCVYKM
jgi:hypothetical protein